MRDGRRGRERMKRPWWRALQERRVEAESMFTPARMCTDHAHVIDLARVLQGRNMRIQLLLLSLVALSETPGHSSHRDGKYLFHETFLEFD